MSIKICSRVCLHFSSVQVQGRKRFCLDTEGSRIWPDERKGISEGTRDGLAKPPFVEHAEAWSGARVFWTHPIAPGMSGVRSSCFPGPQQSFFHRSPNRLGADESIGFGLYDVTFSHPCTTSCSHGIDIPTEYLIAHWKAQRGHPWQLEPLGIMGWVSKLHLENHLQCLPFPF